MSLPVVNINISYEDELSTLERPFSEEGTSNALQV